MDWKQLWPSNLILLCLIYYFLLRIFTFTNCYIYAFCCQKYLSIPREPLCFPCNRFQILDDYLKSKVCSICPNYETSLVFMPTTPTIFAALRPGEQIWTLKEDHSSQDAISFYFHCSHNVHEVFGVYFS